MRKFAYEARDQSNNSIVKAEVQADSETSAARLLTAQGMTPLKIRELSDDEGFFARLTGRITPKDKIVF